MTTIWTEFSKVDVAVSVAIIDAEEKWIIDVIRVGGLICCSQGLIDLVKVIA